jgi:hypothetical protein
MTENLENITDYFEYTLSDTFIPLKPIRHLPHILRIENPIVRWYEIGVNAILTGTQIITAYSLYELLK